MVVVVSVPIRIRDESKIEVDGKAYTTDAPADSAPADSVQTAGGVYTLVLDVDDPEDMLASSLEGLERWEAEHGLGGDDDL